MASMSNQMHQQVCGNMNTIFKKCGVREIHQSQRLKGGKLNTAALCLMFFVIIKQSCKIDSNYAKAK